MSERNKRLRFPTVFDESTKAAQPNAEPTGKQMHPCPCCGCYTYPVPRAEAVAYICPVCFWENDIFTASDDEPSDENHGMSLNEGRENYRSFGACTKSMVIHVRKPTPEELPPDVGSQPTC